MKASDMLGRIELASAAVLPVEPSSDRRVLLTAMALFMAAGAGVGAALLRAALDPSVRQVQDVTSFVHMPFLGHLPKVRFESELWGKDVNILLRESMRMVRTSLLDRVSSDTGCAVLITSPTAQTGKTSVAVLLARSLADVGKRVLLVDADTRRPTLSRRLEVAASAGLADLLEGTADDDDVIQHGCLPGVDVVPAGNGNHRTPELMANGKFSECLRRWRAVYDFVLFDSTPILPVADARIIASQVDGAILALRAAHSRRADAIDAVSQLTFSGGRTLGTVLVGTETNAGYYHSYGGNGA